MKTSSKKVLVIEDEFIIQYNLINMFNLMGFDEVKGVASVQEALCFVNKIKFDLITFDINLLDGNALQIHERMNEINDDTIKIVISAYDNLDFLGIKLEEPIDRYFRRLGFDMYIEKPDFSYFYSNEFEEVINGIIKPGEGR